MTVESFLLNQNISEFCAIPFSECQIQKPYLLQDFEKNTPKTVLLFLIPYYVEQDSFVSSTISIYAQGKDYHQYLENLKKTFYEECSPCYPDYIFRLFTDHSPILETEAAAKAGLGVVGDHHLLINEKYSSFVFIGEIITDAPIEMFEKRTMKQSKKGCLHCGACKASCPTNALCQDWNTCLSYLTQKKGSLSNLETSLLKKGNLIWGCDTCQLSCPYTKNAIKNKTIESPISFFYEKRISSLSEPELDAMSNQDFHERAFSFRGKTPLYRNIELLHPSLDERLLEKPIIVFDLGKTLLSFNPDKLIQHFANKENEEKVYKALFESGYWFLIDSGLYTNEEVANKMMEYINSQDETIYQCILCGLTTFQKYLQPLKLVKDLPKLKKCGKKIYYLTNFAKDPFLETLRIHPFFSLFDGGVYSAKNHICKPDSRIYLDLCNQYHFSPEDALFVDDNLANIEAAQKLGFSTWHYQDS